MFKLGLMPKVPVKVVEWGDVVDWVGRLADRIVSSGWVPDVIVAIARGGYVPARLLADFLGVNDLVSLQVVHWPSAAQVAEKAYIKHELRSDLSGKRVLVVDDIVDTGDSIILAVDHVKKCCSPGEVKSAAMQVIASVTKVWPDYYAIEVRDWVWFQYPWTALEDVTNFIERIVRETGRRVWTLNELVRAMIEWYGEELVDKRFSYIRRAIDRMIAVGRAREVQCGDARCIEFA